MAPSAFVAATYRRQPVEQGRGRCESCHRHPTVPVLRETSGSRSSGSFCAHAVTVPAPETDDHVAIGCAVGDQLGEPVRIGEGPNVPVAAGTKPVHQCVTVHSLDRGFAGRVDVRHEDNVRVVETGAELIKQAFDA